MPPDVGAQIEDPMLRHQLQDHEFPDRPCCDNHWNLTCGKSGRAHVPPYLVADAAEVRKDVDLGHLDVMPPDPEESALRLAL